MAEYVIRFVVAAPQEYVNTYSTRRGDIHRLTMASIKGALQLLSKRHK